MYIKLRKKILKVSDLTKVSLHNHSLYSRDSEGKPEEFIKEAVRQKLEVIGISDHCPLPFPYIHCGIEKNKISDYFKDLNYLKNKYQDKIKVLIGMEIDYLPFNLNFDQSLLNLPIDYSIGSIHFLKKDGKIWNIDFSVELFEEILSKVFKSRIQDFCECYYQTIISLVKFNKFNILGHLDLIKKFNKDEKYFSEKEIWYQKIIDEVITEIAKSKMLVEVNTAGLNKPVGKIYPSDWIVERLIKNKIPIIFSADSHQASLITDHFPNLKKYL